jgi:DNA-binding NtrC family response regulator
VNAGIRTLLVEDKAPLRRSLKSFLEKAGYTSHCCSTAREALMLAELYRHDVVIAEYHLPDADGSTLIEKLKLIIPNAVTILMTPYDLQSIANDVARANVQSVLKKPFDLVDLESALSSARSISETGGDSSKWTGEVCLKSIPASVFK